MNKTEFLLYDLFKTYNQAADVNSIKKVFNGQFTFYDFKKELFDVSVDSLVMNPFYKEFIKAYVR